jgi:hypothetical protein
VRKATGKTVKTSYGFSKPGGKRAQVTQLPFIVQGDSPAGSVGRRFGACENATLSFESIAFEPLASGRFELRAQLFRISMIFR